MNEDAPQHTRHRSAVSLLFNPSHIAEMETMVRDLCATTFEAFVGSTGFDLIHDVGAVVPTQMVGMLIGIPEEDLPRVRAEVEASIQKRVDNTQESYAMMAVHYVVFNEYLDWRVDHPSDDLMTELMNAEFTDDSGAKRRPSRGRCSVSSS